MAEQGGSLAVRDDGSVELRGQFDHRSVLETRAQGEAHIKSLGQRTFRVDLSGVKASDSIFMALLLSWLRLCDARGVEMELVGLPESLFDMVRVSGLDSVLPIVGQQGRQPGNDAAAG